MANFLDRTIAALAPSWGSSREAARLSISRNALKREQFDRAAGIAGASFRKYEGATASRRTAGWITSGGGPNEEIGPALARMRNRSRDLTRNNPWAAKAIRVLCSNIVGTGIRPQALSDNDAEAKAFQQLWADWGESTDCDADGRRNFYGIQKLCQREISEAGEVLVRRRRRRPTDKLRVPLQLQVLEPDMIDLTQHGTDKNGNVTVQGIEFDRLGRRRFYWLYDNHPGERTFTRSFQSRRVPAEAILHGFRDERAGQVHGVPWSAAALIRFSELDQLEDAELVRAKIASMLVAFVHDIDAEVEADDTSDPDSPIDKLESGMVEHLAPGKDVRFNTPPQNEGYIAFAEIGLRAVAAAYGVTYEALTGDLGKVNFSSGRMGWLEMAREIDSWRRLEFIPQLCTPVWRWFGLSAELAGAAPRALPASWTPPRRGMIDPGKETRAIKDQIGAGLISLSEAIRQLGEDPRTVLTELAGDLDLLRELGITVDIKATRVEDEPEPPDPLGLAGAGGEPAPGETQQAPGSAA